MKQLSSWLKQILRWFIDPQYRKFKGFFFLLLFLAGPFIINWGIGYFRLLADPRSQSFLQWAQGDPTTRAELITEQRELCPGAPFVLPADGFIGLFYGDPRGPYSQANPHQGIDIFSNTDPGMTPVYAAYDGYLTREDSWRSSLIIRVPDDPLQPGRTIWLYYTHLADRQGNDFIEDAFSPGTKEMFIEQGTLLGYTGDYNGISPRIIWTHLHFSVVLDDGNGQYLNELDYSNTLDPSPYLGISVNYQCAAASNGCTTQPTCNS
jgi:hypothetical protein